MRERINWPSSDDAQGDEEGGRETHARERLADLLDGQPEVLRLGAGDQVGAAARDLEHPQRDDERRDRPPDADESVDQTAAEADGQT